MKDIHSTLELLKLEVKRNCCPDLFNLKHDRMLIIFVKHVYMVVVTSHILAVFYISLLKFQENTHATFTGTKPIIIKENSQLVKLLTVVL